MNKQVENIPDVTLERFLLGELPPEKMQSIEIKIKQNAEWAIRLEELKQSNKEIIKLYNPEVETRAIERKLHLKTVEENMAKEQKRKTRFAGMPWLIPAAGMVTIILFLTFPTVLTDYFQQQSAGGIRIKGLAPKLEIFYSKNSGPVKLENGDTVNQNDVLQLRYLSAGKKYGAIFSLDGRGSITQHLPEQGDKAVELTHDGMVNLQHAYELDDAPLFERFYFISSDEPFALEKILNSARHSIQKDSISLSLDIPQNLNQEIISLRKGDLQ